ncbi:hypothetical protein Ddc_16369 [Ditylenchus destructor]|nr:hypothetical protein Ddc_16369 [Ditylenchus destructor]
MLCLRRISLDAKSRLLFLSRSHSSTNDSMPKSTAISRLIHKKFLQQNGNNSPQAIFVFVQQRGLKGMPKRTKAPVPVEKDKSTKDKDQKDKSGSTVLNNLGYGVFCAFFAYAVGKGEEYYFISRTKVPENKDKFFDDLDNSDAEAEGWEKSKDEFKFGSGSSGEKPKNKFEKLLYYYIESDFKLGLGIGVVLALMTYRISWTKVPDRTSDKDKFSYDQNDSDAKDSEDEFKFGFGPSGRKPKNKFEEDLYKRLHKKFEKKSEEEFEKFLRWFDPEKFARRVPLYSLASGVGLALLFYTVFRIFRPYSWREFIALFTILPADSYTSTRAHMRMTYGHKCLGK